MATYMLLTKEFANAAVALEAFDDLDENASPTELNHRIIELVGGELIDMYYTAGEYKAALIVEFPNQETMIQAQQQAEQFGVDEMVILDAVHYEDMTETVAN